MQMYENTTNSMREPCTHCGQNHDEMECVRPEHDDTELFDAAYDYAVYRLENGDETPDAEEILEAVIGEELSQLEVESLEDIAQEALRDAKRDQ